VRGVTHAGLLLVLVLASCSDMIVDPALDWPSPSEIGQNKLTDRCVVFDDGLRCWKEKGSQNEIADSQEILLFQRDQYYPEPIPAITFGDDVVAIDGWTEARCVVLAAGDVKCWGINTLFLLGVPGDENAIVGDDENERGAAMPAIDLGTALHAEQVEVSGRSACARFDDGRVKCWGTADATLGLEGAATKGDDPGELGDALPFVDLGSDVRAVGLAASGAHTCIWTADGRMKCWGENDRGQLGIVSPDGEPVGDDPGEMGDALPYVDLGSDVRVVQVSPNRHHTCALTDDGRVKCWGANSTLEESQPDDPPPPDEPHFFGRLGLGDREDRRAPLGDALPYVDLGKDFRAVAISTYGTSSCAVSDDGGLKCWGCCSNQLGYGADQFEIGDEPGEMGDALPFVDLGPGRTVKMIDSLVPCVLLDDDSGRCLYPDNAGNDTTLDVTREDFFGRD
jgi:hypothetical protein